MIQDCEKAKDLASKALSIIRLTSILPYDRFVIPKDDKTDQMNVISLEI
jgi:hypothetical protein